MTLIVVPDDAPPALAGTDAEARLRALGEVRIYDSRALDSETLISRVAGAEIVLNIRSTSIFTRDVLRKLPGLKLISIYGVGYDNIDVKAASELGVTVANTPGYSSVAVAEMALAMALAVARRLVQNDRAIRDGAWSRRYAVQLSGKTLGVIGTGNIGQRMIQLGKAIGMNVIAWTFHPSPERAKAYGVELVSFETLLRESDVVSIHVLASKEAERFIGGKELALMKETAILVNTARGAVIDEAALVDALQNERIAGAGLDVFETEPMPPEHPLKKLDNVVLSPHTAAMVPEATLAGVRTAVENIAAYLAGKPVNIVRPF